MAASGMVPQTIYVLKRILSILFGTNAVPRRSRVCKKRVIQYEIRFWKLDRGGIGFKRNKIRENVPQHGVPVLRRER